MRIVFLADVCGRLLINIFLLPPGRQMTSFKFIYTIIRKPNDNSIVVSVCR